LDDGLIDLRYVVAPRRLGRTRLVLATLTGRLGRSRIYKQHLVKELRVRSLDGPLRLARDGETFRGSDEIVVEKMPERLVLFAPHERN
jgi:undecaprenyl-diphosphatase